MLSTDFKYNVLLIASVVNKDLTLKAKDSKFVLEDTSRSRTTTFLIAG